MPKIIDLQPGKDGTFEPVSIKEDKHERKQETKEPKKEKTKASSKRIKHDSFKTKASPKQSSQMEQMLAGVQLGLTVFNQIRKFVR